MPMKHLNTNSVIGLSILVSLFIMNIFWKPFIHDLSFIYVTPQIIIITVMAVLSLTLYINYLLTDFVKNIKVTPFIVPIFVLLIVASFTRKFFFADGYLGDGLLFFNNEFTINLIAVASLSLLFTTLYKINNKQKELKA